MIVASRPVTDFLINVGVIGAGGVVLGGIGGLLGAAFMPVIVRGLQLVLFLDDEPIKETDYPRYETAVTLMGAGGAVVALLLAVAESWGIIALGRVVTRILGRSHL